MHFQMHKLISTHRRTWWTFSWTGGDTCNPTCTCQRNSQLPQSITIVLQKHYCYFLGHIKYLRALPTSQMPLHIPHLHRHISRYFNHLVRIYLFITVTHLLITPPISNIFYTGTINHIFQKCYALRFNTSSVHSDILRITLLTVTHNFPKYRSTGSMLDATSHFATLPTWENRKLH
jgi:hypothetical protein